MGWHEEEKIREQGNEAARSGLGRYANPYYDVWPRHGLYTQRDLWDEGYRAEKHRQEERESEERRRDQQMMDEASQEAQCPEEAQYPDEPPPQDAEENTDG